MIRPQTCPICKEELPPEIGAESPHFPFCSKRCKQIDLYRWSEGRYAIVEPLSPEQMLDAEMEGETDWPGDDAG